MKKPKPIERGHYCQLLKTIPKTKCCDFECNLDAGVVINLEVAALPIVKKVLDVYLDNNHHVLIEQRGIDFIKALLCQKTTRPFTI